MGATVLLGLYTTQLAHIALTFDSESELYTIFSKVIEASVFGEDEHVQRIVNTDKGHRAWAEFNKRVGENIHIEQPS